MRSCLHYICYYVFHVIYFFFFKQKTAYEMRISDWSSDVCSSDLIVTLGEADGDFVLADTDSNLLLLSAGSGITPMLALLHELRARSRAGGFSGDVRLVHICRDAGDQIFASELRELAKDWPALQIIHWHSARAGRPTPEALQIGRAHV